MKLMLIDDQMSILTSLKEALEPGGFECLLFDDAERALLEFDAENFDVVITDLKMPKIGGIEVLKHVQKHKPGTPVIIMTGYADTENAIQAVNHGAYAFYQKPIKIKKFIGTLKELEEKSGRLHLEQKTVSQLSDERSALLAEVNHRVKNNLQVITSLLRIQFRNAANKEAAEALLNTNNRIQSMALIHDYLYSLDNMAAVKLHEYIPILTRELHRNLSYERDIHFEFDLNAVHIPLDTAVPLGLVLNELIANAIRHAFPESWKGQPEVMIKLLRLDDTRVRIAISDNGAGFPEGFNFETVESLGLAMVRILVSEQLDAALTFDFESGTKTELILPCHIDQV